MLFILEDNEDRIAAFEDVLAGRPHHIEVAVPESIEWLSENKESVTLYSLDNDLILPKYTGDEGEGWQLCEWILQNGREAPIICHTTNTHAAAKMQQACMDAKWEFLRVVPYGGTEWIHGAWSRVLNERLS